MTVEEYIKLQQLNNGKIDTSQLTYQEEIELLNNLRHFLIHEVAEIVLEPNNKKCLFILGMLFVNGVKIKILNEKEKKEGKRKQE